MTSVSDIAASVEEDRTRIKGECLLLLPPMALFVYAPRMEIYDHPTFRMACRQFDLVADHLQIPDSDRGRLKYPKRSMTVALPIHRDDGRTEVLTGYRVQHHL